MASEPHFARGEKTSPLLEVPNRPFSFAARSRHCTIRQALCPTSIPVQRCWRLSLVNTCLAALVEIVTPIDFDIASAGLLSY